MPTHPSNQRHCHYCLNDISTAFYLQVLKAWSCPECYFEHYMPKHSSPASNHMFTAPSLVA